MELVAVYGTLRSGGHNHRFIEQSVGEFIGTIAVLDFPGKLVMERLPMLIQTASRWPVVFELYRVHDLGLIDALEGHPHFYERQLASIGGYTCWVYYYNNTNNSINISNKDNIYDYIYYINNNNKIAQVAQDVKNY